MSGRDGVYASNKLGTRAITAIDTVTRLLFLLLLSILPPLTRIRKSYYQGPTVDAAVEILESGRIAVITDA